MAEPSDPAKTPEKKPAKAASDTKTTAETKKAPAKDAGAESAADKTKGTASAGATKSSSVPGAGGAKPAASQAEAESGGGGGRAFLFLVVVAILVGGGGYVSRDLWLPEVEPYLAKLPGYGTQKSEPEQAKQPGPIEMLNERIAMLEKSVAESGNVDSVMSALKEEKARAQTELEKALSRIDDLENRLAEVRTLASAVTSSSGGEVDLAPILSRIDGLEQKDRETSGEVAALNDKVDSIASKGPGSAGSGVVLAVAQLRDAALSGRPYAAQLDALKSVAADSPEIIAAASRLNGGAAQGLPTIDALQAQFSAIAGDIVAQARTGGGDWMQQAAGKLSSLVSLRRTDGGSGNPVEDAVANIEHNLAQRDMTSAVKTADALAETLDGEAKRILEPWLLDAKARATAERALDAMHASALAALEG